MEQGFVIREVIIQYGTMAEKERKKYKLHRNTNLKELKDRLVNELGIQEEATKRGMGKIDLKLARKEMSSERAKELFFYNRGQF